MLDGQEVIYAVLPLFHAYGLTLCLTFAISVGATLVLLPRFDVDLVLDAMRRRPATFLPGVPPIYERLANAARGGGVLQECDVATVWPGMVGRQGRAVRHQLLPAGYAGPLRRVRSEVPVGQHGRPSAARATCSPHRV